MRQILLLLAIFLAFITAACDKSSTSPVKKEPPAPTLYDSPLATILDSLRYANDLPALAGAIVSDTSIIDAQAVGCRRWCGQANVTNDDLFHLGSDTKALTAVLIGVLIDDGLLTWDSTLPVIFPEYSQTMRSEYKSVTVRDILCHGGGLVGDPTLTLKKTNLIEQRQEVTAWALQQAPTNAKGTFNYSNTGYIMAAAMVDKLTSRSYEDLLFERVLHPLGITSAGFGPMGTPGREDQPLQHTARYLAVEPGPSADNPPIYNSAGRLHMSIGDWARYIHWVLACEAGHPTLVRSETAQILTTGVTAMPGEGVYAMGWAIVDRPWANGKAITHSGSNTMNLAVAWLAPNRTFAVIAATNIYADKTAAAMDIVIWRLISTYLQP